MAEQETRDRGDAETADATSSEAGASTEGAEPEAEGAESTKNSESDTTQSEDSSEKSEESGKKENSGKEDSGKTSEESSGGGGQTAARRSENHAKPQAPSDSDREAQEANRRSFVGGRSEDAPPSGEQRRSSVDVGEIVWKVANILATVIRVVTLVFAVVLVAHIALVVVGVNPSNGVAAFLRGFADSVVLGFRDLFLPADPTIALVVNYGVAAVFWVVVGGFLSAGIRFLAARIN